MYSIYNINDAYPTLMYLNEGQLFEGNYMETI